MLLDRSQISNSISEALKIGNEEIGGRKVYQTNLSSDDVHANDEEGEEGQKDLLPSLKLV